MSKYFNVDDIISNEDGSATLTFSADSDTMLFLAGQGVLRCLEKAIENEEEFNNDKKENG